MQRAEEQQDKPQANTKSLEPTATITRRAAERLRGGYLWVYRSDIEVLTDESEADTPAAGSLVTVMDGRGKPLGTALYSDTSQIALRMISAQPGMTRANYLEDVRERVGSALALRREIARLGPEDNACRLIFSEADGLPGIIADRYNDLIILQLLTQGTAQDDLRSVLAKALAEGFVTGTTVWEREDGRVRELERLDAAPAGPLHGETAKVSTVFTINGMKFHFDASAGQKTGAFLDQRLNYAAAVKYAHGFGLDVCAYQGGFALHLARRCDRVTGVDASRAALEVADRNRELNTKLRAEVDWIEADAFELLREYEGSGQRYDTIVLDPPAFAKSKRAAEGAIRGYKELNLRAMKMLNAGGTLVTCSCSHHVSLAAFLEVIGAAASDAGRKVQMLEIRGAAPDHPAILSLPETSYLKCVICRVG